jgi:6-phosphogluconate dehydrogenase
MKIGLVGLGKMGYNLALNIKEHGHDVIAYDISYEKISEISKEGIIGINNYVQTIAGKAKNYLVDDSVRKSCRYND